MKALTQSVLAAAMLLALPFAAAEACNFSAWNGNASAAGGNGFAGGPAAVAPADRVTRYQGLCANRTNANQFVIDNTPNAEATFRMRVMVYLSGTGKFFSATTTDGGGGTEVFGLSYTGGNIVVSGATGVASVPAAANTWQGIEVLHVAGQPFSLSVRGGGATTPTTRTGTSLGTSVGSVSLGSIGAGSTIFAVDSYESTRSAATPIGFLCRGNANIAGGSANTRDINDVTTVISEINRTAFAAGQPDFTEDGQVNINDVTGLIGVLNSVTPGC